MLVCVCVCVVCVCVCVCARVCACGHVLNGNYSRGFLCFCEMQQLGEVFLMLENIDSTV